MRLALGIVALVVGFGCSQRSAGQRPATKSVTKKPATDNKVEQTWRSSADYALPKTDRGLAFQWAVWEAQLSAVAWKAHPRDGVDICWDSTDKPCAATNRASFATDAAFLSAVIKRSKGSVFASGKGRAIDKLFWALKAARMNYTWTSDQESHLYDAGRLAELDHLVGWLAKRHGLARSARAVLDFQPKVSKAKFITRGDVFFGAFVDDRNVRWECGQDAPPGKYCCYVYCRSASENMAQGH